MAGRCGNCIPEAQARSELYPTYKDQGLEVLTLALALFKQGLVTRLRKAVPYVQLASSVLLVLAGAYVIYYWLSYGSSSVLPG